MGKFELNELKVAVINRDLTKLKELSDKTPEVKEPEDARELLRFIKEAIEILLKEKLKTSEEMKKIRKLKKFNETSPKEHVSFRY